MTRGGAGARLLSVMRRMVPAEASREPVRSSRPEWAGRHRPATEASNGPQVQSGPLLVITTGAAERRLPRREPALMATTAPVTDRAHKAAKRYIYAWGERPRRGRRDDARPARRQGRRPGRDDQRRPARRRPASRSRPRPATTTSRPASSSRTGCGTTSSRRSSEVEAADRQGLRRRRRTRCSSASAPAPSSRCPG